jgi:thymidylate synthase (FAD)
MQILEPKVEAWLPLCGMEEHIARCARVCYASNKIGDNFLFAMALWKNNHRSMFRHAGVYYIIPKKLEIDPKAYIDADVHLHGFNYYVSTNAQAAKEYWDEKYRKYRIDTNSAFIDNSYFRKDKTLRITMCITTGIDITREFNRKSPNAIAEQSTRYVDFIKKIGIRFKQCHWMYGLSIYKYCLTRFMAKTAELFYRISRSKYGLNLPPEDARWILPLDTMSKVVYTYTIAEWERIINMRLWDSTGKAHPDAKAVATKIKDELERIGFTIEKYNSKT